MQYFVENVERISQTFSRSSSMQVENSSISSSVERFTDEEPPPSYFEAILQTPRTENNISSSEIEQDVSISTNRLSDYIAQNISLHE
ncbi:4555_t:CDS:2 [Scutellospora calospora]|uniref:4555_t:CDS:1 n=1 Tax=Scutellospora calospora TaxID=85575 RepID=A0ACA9KJX1_9GLOM|nr:4555_t:CDS:2 [Scutellospora calospora]